jgi:CO/xanthine dehydrogenase Mo-binding subunit
VKAFVTAVMAKQTEPFLNGIFAGQMPADVYRCMQQARPAAFAGQAVMPVLSKRQLALDTYMQMLGAYEHNPAQVDPTEAKERDQGVHRCIMLYSERESITHQ